MEQSGFPPFWNIVTSVRNTLALDILDHDLAPGSSRPFASRLLVRWVVAAYGFGAVASTFARLRRRRAASACFLRRFTLGFM